ncbi:CAP domain-containing protein [Fimbriiglobus ruber]|uniref:SCP domain-containing protein n=1 Tax=Fimbriiglobus ruber TaxID=1908690 RepID=A0A225DEK4_9BACT|nr:CAP domain-containing protein [Fimbriiglobus ruber]OWK35776.1 hypothetical protein FRUB_08339 [Fimbriiglobus ruber]
MRERHVGPLPLDRLAAPWLPSATAQKSDDLHVEKIEVPKVADASGKRPDLAGAAKAVVEATNAFRKTNARGAVPADAKLTAAAQSFADYMARTDEYGHGADGNNPGERAKQHGYDYCLIGENIAYAFDSKGFETRPLADTFATGWEKSPPHRRNMLDPDVTATGVAVARSETTGYYYAVQLFGRPKSAAIVFKVENRSDAGVAYKLGDAKFDLPPRVIRTHTVCRPPELTFTWSDGKTRDVKPLGGDRLVVTKTRDEFSVTKE